MLNLVVHIVTTELLRVQSNTQNWKYGFFTRNMIVRLPLSQYAVVQILRKESTQIYKIDYIHVI